MTKQGKFDTATFSGFVAILLWSTTVAFARSISESLGPFTSGASIYLIAGMILYAARILNRKPSIKSIKPSTLYLFGCGAFFVIYTLCLYIAVSMASNATQTLEIGLINYLWPGLTILLSIPILGKKGNFWLLPGTAIALAGVFLALTQGTQINWGTFIENAQRSIFPYLTGFIAAISWALYSNFSRRWGGNENEGAVPLFMVITGLVFACLAILFPEKMIWNTRVIFEILFFSSATAIAYISWDLSMRKGNILLVAASSYLVPFLSTVVSSVYLKIVPTPFLWWGCLFIIIGSLISWKSIKD